MVVASPNGHRFKNGGNLTCVEKAFRAIAEGADVLDALIAGVNIVELDPADTSVGFGGLPNADGVVALDSCCMHGPRKRAGGVAEIEGVKTPSLVARAVMDLTDHHLIVGQGATEFARQPRVRGAARPQHRDLTPRLAGVEAPHRPAALPDRPDDREIESRRSACEMMREFGLDAPTLLRHHQLQRGRRRKARSAA